MGGIFYDFLAGVVVCRVFLIYFRIFDKGFIRFWVFLKDYVGIVLVILCLSVFIGEVKRNFLRRELG